MPVSKYAMVPLRYVNLDLILTALNHFKVAAVEVFNPMNCTIIPPWWIFQKRNINFVHKPLFRFTLSFPPGQVSDNTFNLWYWKQKRKVLFSYVIKFFCVFFFCKWIGSPHHKTLEALLCTTSFCYVTGLLFSHIINIGISTMLTILLFCFIHTK